MAKTRLVISVTLIWVAGSVTLLTAGYSVGYEYKEKTTFKNLYLGNKMTAVFDNQTSYNPRNTTTNKNDAKPRRDLLCHIEDSKSVAASYHQAGGLIWYTSLAWSPVILVTRRYQTQAVIGILGLVQVVGAELSTTTEPHRPNHLLDPHTCAFLCSDNYNDCNYQFEAQVAYSERVTATITGLKESVKEEQGKTEDCHETRDLMEIANQVENMKIGKLEEELRREKRKFESCHQALRTEENLAIGLYVWAGLSMGSTVLALCWIRLRKKPTPKAKKKARESHTDGNSSEVLLNPHDTNMVNLPTPRLKKPRIKYAYSASRDGELSKVEDNLHESEAMSASFL